jgi:hypothetical protein
MLLQPPPSLLPPLELAPELEPLDELAPLELLELPFAPDDEPPRHAATSVADPAKTAVQDVMHDQWPLCPGERA